MMDWDCQTIFNHTLPETIFDRCILMNDKLKLLHLHLVNSPKRGYGQMEAFAILNFRQSIEWLN